LSLAVPAIIILARYPVSKLLAGDNFNPLADNARGLTNWSEEMSRIATLVLTLVFCSTAFAESVLYVCERPAWDGMEGCGPNNTYETYSMSVDTGDFGNKHSKYNFRMSKGCDAKKGRRYKYDYNANDETIVFSFNAKPSSSSFGYGKMSTIKLDLDSMKAVMSGVEDSPVLSCRIE